jgi:hypothetical protein
VREIALILANLTIFPGHTPCETPLNVRASSISGFSTWTNLCVSIAQSKSISFLAQMTDTAPAALMTEGCAFTLNLQSL